MRIGTGFCDRWQMRVIVAATLGWSGGLALAGPAWYTAGTGGFNPQVPDFYQHQDWVTTGATENSANGWESETSAPGGAAAGWCFQTAYADVFYDLTKQGYAGLYTGGTDPTANPWYAAMYGADNTNANVVKSDIYQLNKNMGNIQTYLDNNVNNQLPVTRLVNPLPALRSNTWDTDANTGNVTYQVRTDTGVKTEDTTLSIFSFSNAMINDIGGEVLLDLAPGTANKAANANGQNLWWTNFHEVAVAGIGVANSTLYIADPDTNPTNPAGATGSVAANGGWPTDTANFPGAGPPVAGGSFGLMTPSTAGLPVPAAPKVGTAASYNQNYAGFQFNNAAAGKKNYVSSTDSPQYNNTVLNQIATITPKIEEAAAAEVSPGGAGKQETAVTVELPSTANGPVDQIFIEPSQAALDPSLNPTFDSLTDASEPSSSWSDAEDTTDPFGNSLQDDGIDYDLSSGTGLEPGESAKIDIGTDAAFADQGFDILLHFQGDPADVWLPEMIGGTGFDPSDNAAEQDLPEPASTGIIVLAGLGILGRRKRDGRIAE